MSQQDAQTAVLQAVHEGALSPYGQAKAQMQDTTAYVAIPIELTAQLGIHQGQEFQRGYHAETGTFVVSLHDDVDLFGSGL